MRTYREQAFQKFRPKFLPDGARLPICQVDVTALRRIQRGTMHHSWKGVMCNKNPFDLAIYAQLMWEIKPATIIEIGYKYGGSALWFADQADAMGLDTKLFCIDVAQRETFSDPRIMFVHGDGNDLGACLPPSVLATLQHPWMIVEDADHLYGTTLNVLKFFGERMHEGDYIAVEDGICDTFGTQDKLDGGPNKAIYEYFRDYPDIFQVDAHYCDFFGNNVTWCTNGFLRKT